MIDTAISGSENPVPRSPVDIACRVLALFAVVDRAHDEDFSRLSDWVDSHNIRDYMSPNELLFFDRATPSQNEIVQYSWRAEATVPLFWALYQLDELPLLTTQVSWDHIVTLPNIINDPDSFIQKSKRRPVAEIEAAESELYHQHWRVRDAQLFEKPMPDEVNPGIVYERRYAASWLVGWGNSTWDNVSTDT